ncbi:MAG: nucleotidyltransferase family protein [Actinomycetota bacterium]|nr:nucleotidyltransferase family protein [Actinomycetota bacterium]
MATFWGSVDTRRLAAVCDRYGIAALHVFGSAARDEDTPGSDIDLLYELLPGTRLGWEIDDLADELSDLFGRTVDLVARRAINLRLREAILHDARPLYAA